MSASVIVVTPSLLPSKTHFCQPAICQSTCVGFSCERENTITRHVKFAKLNAISDSNQNAINIQTPFQSHQNLETPLLDALTQQASSGDAPFHFPGHKRGHGAPTRILEAFGGTLFSHDLPELPELDNLFAPEAAILEAQNQAAEVFGSDKTFFLVNGSTVGVQAAVMALCPSGKTLIVPRNAHQCAFSAMVLSGANPKYIFPEYDEKWGISLGVDPETVRAALEEAHGEVEVEKEVGSGEEQEKRSPHMSAKVGAVLIVSPTYHGVCSDIQSIAAICHLHGVPLIVDEAHGAHFSFHDEFRHLGSLQQGADVAIQSTHKSLGSLTQSAMLHVKTGRVDQSRVATCLHLLQSSSPSYLLMASLDAATWQMGRGEGRSLLVRGIELALEARKRLAEIPGVRVLGPEDLGIPPSHSSHSTFSSHGRPGVAALDVLKVCVSLKELGLGGYEVDDILRLEFGVVAELPETDSLTFAFSAGTTDMDVNRLVGAYKSIAETYSMERTHADNVEGGRADTVSNWGEGEKEKGVESLLEAIHAADNVQMTPREAFFSEVVRVPMSHAIGELSGEMLCPYPPGIPVLAPGEVITESAVMKLKVVLEQGGSISGAKDATLETTAIIRKSNLNRKRA